MKEALKKLKTAAREALPATGFAQREEAMLAIFEEAQRGLVEEELQSLADGFSELLPSQFGEQVGVVAIAATTTHEGFPVVVERFNAAGWRMMFAEDNNLVEVSFE